MQSNYYSSQVDESKISVLISNLNLIPLMSLFFSSSVGYQQWAQSLLPEPDYSNVLCFLLYQDVVLTDELKTAIQNARTTFLTSTSKLGVDYMQYTKFGKDFIKTKKLSPDSFMQLAFQVRPLTLQTVLA